MSTATYSLVSGNIFTRAAEVATSAVTGKPASVNSLREVTDADVKQWRAMQSQS